MKSWLKYIYCDNVYYFSLEQTDRDQRESGAEQTTRVGYGSGAEQVTGVGGGQGIVTGTMAGEDRVTGVGGGQGIVTNMTGDGRVTTESTPSQ
jgi:hypothetical protein